VIEVCLALVGRRRQKRKE